VLAAEELARVDINTPTAVLATGLGLAPIIHFGAHEQKEKFLRPFTDGEPRLAAFGFTEVTGGANFDSIGPEVGVQTFAELDGEEWVINGAKHYTTRRRPDPRGQPARLPPAADPYPRRTTPKTPPPCDAPARSGDHDQCVADREEA
jgi:hypothetical protein